MPTTATGVQKAPCPIPLSRRLRPKKGATIASGGRIIQGTSIKGKCFDIAEEIETHLSMVTVAGIPASDELFAELAEETQKDPEMSRLVPYILSEWPGTRQQVHHEVRAYWDNRHLLSTVKGIVIGERIFITRTLRT